MNSRTRNNLTGLLLLAPHLVGLSLFFLIPFLWVLGRSLNGSHGIGIANYRKLWSNEAFLLAVKNTFILTGITVPVLLIVSLSVALLAKRYLRSGHWVLHTFVLNYAIPTASIAYIWTLLYGNHGWLNEGLSYFHLSSPINWLDGRALYIPIVSLFLFKYTAYPAIILYGGLRSLPPSIYEAASVDGATSIQRFRYVTLPMLIPELIFAAMLGFFFNFKIYKEAYALFGSYPPKSIYVVQHYMSNHFYKMNMDQLATAASIMTIALSLLIIAMIRMNRKVFFP